MPRHLSTVANGGRRAGMDQEALRRPNRITRVICVGGVSGLKNYTCKGLKGNRTPLNEREGVNLEGLSEVRDHRSLRPTLGR